LGKVTGPDDMDVDNGRGGAGSGSDVDVEEGAPLVDNGRG